MSGVAVPTPWPTAIADVGVGEYPVIIVDDGSYMLKDVESNVLNEASMVVRVEGLPDTANAIKLAIDAAIAAYPSHPSDGCMVLYTVGPIFGSRRTDGNSMISGRGMTTDPGFVSDAGKNTGTTGTVVIVKMLYHRQTFLIAQASSPVIRVMRGDGTDYSVSADGKSRSGTVTVQVVGVASRAEAIAAAEALYPTHPDDATMPYLGASARLVGLMGCTAANQIWEVTLKFGSTGSNIVGLNGISYHSMPGRTQDDSGTISVKYVNQASIAAAIAQALTDYPVHPFFATSPPVVGANAVAYTLTDTGYDVTVVLTYDRVPFDLQAYIRAGATATSSQYARVTPTHNPAVSALSPTNFRLAVSTGGAGSNYAMTRAKTDDGVIQVSATYPMPAVQIEIFTRTSIAPTPPVGVSSRVDVTANGTTYTKATFAGLTSTPVQVDTGLGLFVQFDNTYTYVWGKEYSEVIGTYDVANKRWPVAWTISNPT